MSSSVSSKLVLVTGANKGIGYGIIENFLCRSGYHILLGSRDQKRGEDAVNALKSRKNNLSTVEFLSLDVNDDKSVNAAAEEVKRKFHGLDILINNAGIASKGSTVTYEIARTTIDTNYYGALRVLRAFTPLLKEGSRVVNVSSTMGQRSLQLMSETIRNRFLSEDLTLDGLNGLMEEFIAAVKDGSYIDKGWPNNTYGVSKSGMTMLGRLWAKEIKLNDVIVSSVCPNWVRTDMGGPNALRSVEEGAVTPVYCSLLSKGSPNGKFWRDEQLQPYV